MKFTPTQLTAILETTIGDIIKYDLNCQTQTNSNL